MSDDDLGTLTLPPPLNTIDAGELPGRVADGGERFASLVNGWARALGEPAPSLPNTPQERAELVGSLVAEGQARRILAGSRAQSSQQQAVPNDGGAAARLRGALVACCAALRVDRPASGESPQQTIARLRKAAEEQQTLTAASTTTLMPTVPAATVSTVSALLGPVELDEADMTILTQVAEALRADYATRRAMLLKRLDVMIATFTLSDRAAPRRDELLAAVDQLRRAIPPAATFTAADALSADSSLLELQRATPLHGDASVKKVRIGRVPDRGGRAQEAYYATETFVEQVSHDTATHVHVHVFGDLLADLLVDQAIARTEQAKGGGKGRGGKGGGGGGKGGGGKGGGGGGRGKGGGGGGGGGGSGRVVVIEDGGSSRAERQVVIDGDSERDGRKKGRG